MRRRRLLLAAVTALLVASGAAGCGGDRPYRVTARIGDAEGIQKNFVVRVDGVQAGRVADVGVARGDVAWVKLDLDRSAAPIGPGARLSARAANLLGEKYLDLSPGDRTHPLPSGSTIPLSRTRSEVQLDDVFNTLAPTTRAQLRILINEAGIGLAGRGTDLNALLGQLPGTLRESRALLSQVTGQNADLGRLIDQGERVLTPQDAHRREVSGFVRSFASLLQTTADRRADLAATVRAAPGALAQVRRSLDRVAATAGHLRPAAALLRTAAPPLATVLARLPAFAGSAHGTLRTAQEVAPALRRLGTRGTPQVRRLTQTLRRTSAFAAALRPVVESVGRGGVFAGLLNVMQNWTRSINQQDANGHYFRLRLVISPTAVNSLVSALTPARPQRGGGERHGGAKAAKALADAAKKALSPPGRPAAPDAPAARPNPLAPVTGAVKKALDTLLPGVTGKAAPSAPSPPPNTVGALLDYLLK